MHATKTFEDCNEVHRALLAFSLCVSLCAGVAQGQTITLRMLLMPERTYPSMFDAHLPFQIDGNFGGAAGIAEMLLQSHRARIRLPTGVAEKWPDRVVTGLRARGGFAVDRRWSAGTLERATIASSVGERGTLVY